MDSVRMDSERMDSERMDSERMDSERMDSEATNRGSRPRADLEDDQMRARQMNDPEVQARIKQAFEEAKRGDPVLGVSAEELPEFLREFE